MGVQHLEMCEELQLLKTNDIKATERHCKLIEKNITRHNCLESYGRNKQSR
jgi:hypothetical protein